MQKLSSLFFIGIMLIAALLQGCNNGPATLKFNPGPGAKYKYIFTTHQVIEPEGLGASVTINQDLTMEYSYLILPDSANYKRVKVTYDRIAIKSGNSMMSMEYDSNDSTKQKDSVFRNMSQFLNRSFTLTLNGNGEIVRSENLQAITSAADSTMAAAGAQGFDPQVSDSSMRTMMLQTLNVYPSRPVKKGDSWKHTYNTSMGFMNMTFDNTYKLVSISDNIAHIEINSNIGANKSKGGQMEIRGLQTGDLDMDVTTGMVLGSKCNQEIKGSMQAFGKVIPLNVTSETHITEKEY
ncbi:MAG TPA: DUF6263 family protein [Flavipsychrobacter sp.]|nr:DUF6263 family protein [Flavipsychrobacter sp.]